MPLDPRFEALKRRATRALGDNQVDDAVQKVRAIIGPTTIPNSEAAAQRALDLLHQGLEPSPAELQALEVVVRLLRPVVFSRNGQLDDLPDDNRNLYSQEDKDRWSAFRSKVTSLLFSIGRIDLGNAHKGTGFLVADDLLATNRHVLAALTSGAEVLGAGVAKVLFKQEVRSTNPPQHIVSIDGVAAIHPTLDMVLLRLQPLGRPVVSMSTVRATEESRVVAIGYPAKDEANNPLFLASTFGADFGNKRASLGEVLPGTAAPTLVHDCSTTQGNSGSPIFDLDSGLVVGIHRSGFFMYRNEALDADALRQFVGAHTS
jgi:S1-C subfamily serine protease